MGKTIENLVRSTQGLATALAFVSLTSCAVYARRDYNQYPAHRKEIAMSNMRAIARDGRSIIIDNSYLSFNFNECVRYRRVTSGGPVRMDYDVCDQEVSHSGEMYWGSIRRITTDERKVIVCDDSSRCVTLGFRDSRQAADFAEAMSVYLQ